MIQRSRILRNNFLTDLDLFVKEDADFAEPYASNWQSLIDDCASFTI